MSEINELITTEIIITNNYDRFVVLLVTLLQDSPSLWPNFSKNAIFCNYIDANKTSQIYPKKIRTYKYTKNLKS